MKNAKDIMAFLLIVVFGYFPYRAIAQYVDVSIFSSYFIAVGTAFVSGVAFAFVSRSFED